MTANPDTSTLSLKVNETDAGARLDSYLAAHVDGWSRARLQRLIESGDVLVNSKVAKASYKVAASDEIEVELTPSLESNFTPENIPLDIVYEDEHVIVINKPAGLVVHPAAGVHSGTLANALAYHFQQLANAGSVRPGIVHRLDKDTSGLLVAAKTELAHERLGDQFRAREVFKSYVALVYGVIKQTSGRIEQPIARDPRNRTRMAIVAGGRGALSLYKVRRSYAAFTLVDVELKTGRTHQIRVHLASLKHPVVADELYGGGRDNSVQDVQLRARIRKLQRQFLHAEQLGFQHPETGESMKFVAPLPVELTEFLEALEER
ncbi:MAG TPA: RluA family pseudouridine synthase [Pyrinomonadaceae bacterium]|jgi:23S rRNA pseudouridine1911/1915/1917 synthase|nr:RluA family pseudouridine synthase [Pyrinomonadaceae bacterium]